jgi:hypothetical protein
VTEDSDYHLRLDGSHVGTHELDGMVDLAVAVKITGHPPGRVTRREL